MSAHTPGPWIVLNNQKGGVGVYVTPSQYNVLDHTAPGVDVLANARLIAAAPRMLAALKRAAYAHSLVGAARASASDALYGPEGEITAILREEGSNG